MHIKHLMYQKQLDLAVMNLQLDSKKRDMKYDTFLGSVKAAATSEWQTLLDLGLDLPSELMCEDDLLSVTDDKAKVMYKKTLLNLADKECQRSK